MDLMNGGVFMFQSCYVLNSKGIIIEAMFILREYEVRKIWNKIYHDSLYGTIIHDYFIYTYLYLMLYIYLTSFSRLILTQEECSQPAFTCPKLTIEAPEQVVKYV